MRILLIEDDPMIGETLTQALENEGMAVDLRRTGPEGERAIEADRYACVLLDLNLPGKSGIEVLRSTRAAGYRAPLVIITARDFVDDRVEGLDLGADDYLVKPFETRELVARMRAVIRRRTGDDKTLQGRTMSLDLTTRNLTYAGQTRELTRREFALMRSLMVRPGAILSRADLEARLYSESGDVDSNALDVLIHSMRKRFDKDIILNVRGAGWMVAKR